MGTRSLVVFENEWGEEIVVVYRQYDGYPSGRGRELSAFLENRVCVNGFNDVSFKQSNGIEDLAAQWIAHEKADNGSGEHLVGSVYLYPAGTRNLDEEYIYTVKRAGDGFSLTCRDVYERCLVSPDGEGD
jgi:hypothetical protein